VWRAIVNHRFVYWIRCSVGEDAGGQAGDQFLDLKIFATREDIVVDECVISPAAEDDAFLRHRAGAMGARVGPATAKVDLDSEVHAPELNLVLEIREQSPHPGCQVDHVGRADLLEEGARGCRITQVTVAAASRQKVGQPRSDQAVDPIGNAHALAKMRHTPWRTHVVVGYLVAKIHSSHDACPPADFSVSITVWIARPTRPDPPVANKYRTKAMRTTAESVLAETVGILAGPK
jgi:hypothetical protein